MATNNSTSVRALALSILGKKRDSAWDSAGTKAKTVSHGDLPAGTAKSESIHALNPFVPVSHTLGTGTVGQPLKAGTELGTAVGQADEIPLRSRPRSP